MTNKQVAESFINNGKPCKSLHMSHSGEFLYSYNATIARRVSNSILVVAREGWSVTTTRHIGLVYHKCCITVRDVLRGKEYNILCMKNNIKYLRGKMKRARNNKEYYADLIKSKTNELRRYKKLKEERE